MYRLIHSYYKKITKIALVISSSFIFLNHTSLQASLNNTNIMEEELPSSKSTQFKENVDFVRKDLRLSDLAIKEVVYNTEGTFTSASCELTKIYSTPCYKGEGKKGGAFLSTKYDQILIPAISTEEGAAKIIQPSSDSQEQKNLIENLDRRHQVKWSQLQEWPYRIHGHLIMKYAQDTYTGSGVLVGPHHVLTAAHNIYNRNGQWAQEVLFAPGRHEDKYPYGDCKGCILLVPQQWSDKKVKDKERESYDFGMVILDTAIGKITGWSGLLSLPKELLTEWPVTVTGYPGDKGTGNYHSSQMWEMQGDMKTVTDHQFYYDIDTWEGQSGSAVWGQEWPGYKGPYTVGVHTYRQDKEGEGNKGTRLNKEKFDLILYWLQAYQLTNVLSIPLPSQQHSLPSTELNFLDEVPEHYKSRFLRAKAGEAAALYEIGKLYLEGFESTPGDNNKAYAFFYKAAKKGYGPAITALGAWYEQQDEQQHLLKAIHLYQMAKDKKNAEAMRRLALLYLEGLGAPKNGVISKSLLKEASEKGDGEASYHLARLYDEGIHVTQNKEYAAKLYEQARTLGYETLPKVNSTKNEKEQAVSKSITSWGEEIKDVINDGSEKGSLNLKNKKITVEDLKIIKDTLKEKDRITKLDLSNSNLNGEEAIKEIGSIVRQNSKIVKLKLDNNNLNNLMKFFLDSFKGANLTHLSLINTNLGEEDFFNIARLSKKALLCLEEIDLSNNKNIGNINLNNPLKSFRKGVNLILNH